MREANHPNTSSCWKCSLRVGFISGIISSAGCAYSPLALSLQYQGRYRKEAFVPNLSPHAFLPRCSQATDGSSAMHRLKFRIAPYSGLRCWWRRGRGHVQLPACVSVQILYSFNFTIPSLVLWCRSDLFGADRGLRETQRRSGTRFRFRVFASEVG